MSTIFKTCLWNHGLNSSHRGKMAKTVAVFESSLQTSITKASIRSAIKIVEVLFSAKYKVSENLNTNFKYFLAAAKDEELISKICE